MCNKLVDYGWHARKVSNAKAFSIEEWNYSNSVRGGKQGCSYSIHLQWKLKIQLLSFYISLFCFSLYFYYNFFITIIIVIYVFIYKKLDFFNFCCSSAIEVSTELADNKSLSLTQSYLSLFCCDTVISKMTPAVLLQQKVLQEI